MDASQARPIQNDMCRRRQLCHRINPQHKCSVTMGDAGASPCRLDCIPPPGFILPCAARYAAGFNPGGRSMHIVSRWLAALSVLSFAYAAVAETVPTGPLPRTVVPSLVALELRLDPRQPRFSGTTRIEANVSEPTATIW